MSSRSKEKGSQYERDVLAYLLKGGIDYERLRQVGKEDEGDGVVRGHHHPYTVCELKAENRIDLPGYLRELAREKDYFAKHRSLDPNRVGGLVIVKRRMASVGESYVVTTVDDYFEIG